MNKTGLVLVCVMLVLSILPIAACSSNTTTATTAPVASSAPASTAATTSTTSSAPTSTTTNPATTSAPATTTTTQATTAPASSTTPTTASSFKINLSLSNSGPLTSGTFTIGIIPWTNEITKETGGRVTFTLYPSETLLKSSDQYDGVVKDIVDVSMATHATVPGRFPLFEVFSLPIMSASTTLENTAIIQSVFNQFPEMQEEHNDVHLLSLTGTVPYQIHTTKKPVRALQDMKGLRFAGPTTAKLLPPGLGAIPVQMSGGEFYSALDKGVVDGIIVPWGVVHSQGLDQLLKYHTVANLGADSQWTAMNIGVWNKLPPDVQQVFNNITMALPQYWPAVTIAQDQAGIDAAKKLGYEIITLSPDERAKWVEAAKPVWDKWVSDTSAKGLPAQAVLDATLKLVNAANAGS